MATCIGTNPPDFNAPTGQFRLLANDTVASDLNPAVSGQGDFALFSDSEIAGYMAMYPNSMLRAVATAYQSLAGRGAMEAKLIKDYDLQVDLSKRAAALLDAAKAFFDRAEEQELRDGTYSTFGVTAPDTHISFRELSSIPIEAWAYLEDVDSPGWPFPWRV